MNVFAERLLNWYKDNARDLPWRATSDPYRIWLSEIILQQTRVEQGMPYYLRFTEQYPDVRSLASAEEQEVLKLWQGLGYYSRARNLHAAARQVCEEFEGRFPVEYEKLLKLKGVGAYTAAAIASICHNEPVPVVDGNVYRFISRYLALETPIATPSAHREFSTLLKEWMPDLAGMFNQALMEFGALHCTPRNPDCARCPFQVSCLAYAQNRVEDFPVKAGKTKVQERWICFLDFRHGNKRYLQRQDDSGIWKKLWLFPYLEFNEPFGKDQIAGLLKTRYGLSTADWVLGDEWNTRHLLSHRKLHVTFQTIILNQPLDKNAIFECDAEELGNYPLPRIMEKYLEKK